MSLSHWWPLVPVLGALAVLADSLHWNAAQDPLRDTQLDAKSGYWGNVTASIDWCARGRATVAGHHH